jgi:basic membrane protein A and related proteins
MVDSKRRKVIGCGVLGALPCMMASAAIGAVEPLKVGFVYVGPVGDGGWTFAHEQARKSVQAQLGEKIETSFLENVPEGAEAEKAFRELAARGNKLIFGTSFGYLDAMLKVARDYPQIKFHHAAGNKFAPNLSIYEARTYEGAYLAGILAGKVSKTGKLGFVASLPIPEVYRNINAFTLGAQTVNPGVTTQVAWAHAWFEPKREHALALQLIGQGADVLIQNTDSPAVLQAAQEKGVKAFGWDSDMKHYGPKAHLASASIDWAPYYRKTIDSVLQQHWKQEVVWLGARHNVIRLASPNPELPQELILLLGERTHELKSGKLHPFQGPVTSREGMLMVAPGQVPHDLTLRQMDYLVQNVIGPAR